MAKPEASEATERRTRLSPEKREQAILDGAVRYFSEVGFDGNMRDLATRLGISHALLFRYFPTKDVLVDRVYDRIFLGNWDPEWDQLLGDDALSFEERLVRFYVGYLHTVDRPEWVRTFIYGGLAGVNINQRYLKLIARKVIAPVALELGTLVGQRNAPPASARAVPSPAAMELSWGLHGEIFYLAIRRWVYGLAVTSDHDAFVAMSVAKFLEGAPAALRREAKEAAATSSSRRLPRS